MLVIRIRADSAGREGGVCVTESRENARAHQTIASPSCVARSGFPQWKANIVPRCIEKRVKVASERLRTGPFPCLAQVPSHRAVASLSGHLLWAAWGK